MYLPWKKGEDLTKNEDNAIEVLRSIHILENNFQKKTGSDDVRNLFFQEFNESASGENRYHLSVIGEEYQGDDLSRHGYKFRIYLPDSEGHGVTFRKREAVSQRKAINHIACYSWPEKFGVTGRRTFLLLATGTIMETENQKRKYEGSRCVPKPGAGFDAVDPERIVDASSVSNKKRRGRGADGQIWTRVTFDD